MTSDDFLEDYWHPQAQIWSCCLEVHGGGVFCFVFKLLLKSTKEKKNTFFFSGNDCFCLPCVW